jgi:hypothetical protein
MIYTLFVSFDLVSQWNYEFFKKQTASIPSDKPEYIWECGLQYRLFKFLSKMLISFRDHSLHPRHSFRLIGRGLGRRIQHKNLFLLVFSSTSCFKSSHHHIPHHPIITSSNYQIIKSTHQHINTSSHQHIITSSHHHIITSISQFTSSKHTRTSNNQFTC